MEEGSSGVEVNCFFGHKQLMNNIAYRYWNRRKNASITHKAPTNLVKANCISILSEASSAEHEAILADETVVVSTAAAI